MGFLPAARANLRQVRFVLAVALAALGVGVTGCVGGSASGASNATTVHLVGFSTPKEANDALEREWAETADGKGVTWQESYGASGDQSRAVAGGLQADYVNFSLAPDVTRLVKAGLVAPGWDAGATKGMVTDSVVVIVVRSGNPKHIHGWADLVLPGVQIITPNPASSGSARWNVLAAYEHALSTGGTAANARAYLTQFFTHVVALPGSGREATTAFLHGNADALISYEDEAILARRSGEQIDYVVPSDTVLIENPAAVLTKASPKAASYLRFVLSPPGQQTFASFGFRPVVAGTNVGRVTGANDPAHPFPAPAHLVTVAQLGGWTKVTAEFFDDATGLVPQIQQQTGRSQ